MGALFSLVLLYNKQVSHKQENKHVLITHKDNEGGGGGHAVTNLSYFRFIFMSRFMFIFVKEHSTTIMFASIFPCVASIVCLVYQLIFCIDYFGLHFPEFITP